MGHHDVKVKASGLPGDAKVIGITVTYQISSIPTAAVELLPFGDIKIVDQSFGDIDVQKREKDISFDIQVYTHTGLQSGYSRRLNFVGLLDGLSIANAVGGNSYRAVIKSKSQRLLELTTVTPGLYPTSVNIYKNPSFSTVIDPQAKNNAAVIAYGNLAGSINTLQGCIPFYTDLMKLIIKKQKSGWQAFCGLEKLASGQPPFEAIFQDERYQKALSEAEEIFNNVDLSAVTGGVADNALVSSQTVADKVKEAFTSGSNILLENYMGFLSWMGCSVVFSDKKMYVVPSNSVLKQSKEYPAKRQIQSKPNTAGPADYNSYSYNDNGYRDISSIIVSTGGVIAGHYLGGVTFDNGAIAHFSEKKGLSQASGVMVVRAHPWMYISPSAPSNEDSNKLRQNLDKKKGSMYASKKSYKAGVKLAKSHAKKAEKKKKDLEDPLKQLLDNFAETKFYQMRYQDRQGSITLDFNPNWVPGTGGSLYIRETAMFIHFHVVSVTHKIDVSAPNHGSAITVVNFNCGRIGDNPAGTEEDKFLGYNTDKEQALQAAFVGDIT
jgi:hypothetical protein